MSTALLQQPAHKINGHRDAILPAEKAGLDKPDQAAANGHADPAGLSIPDEQLEVQSAAASALPTGTLQQHGVQELSCQQAAPSTQAAPAISPHEHGDTAMLDEVNTSPVPAAEHVHTETSSTPKTIWPSRVGPKPASLQSGLYLPPGDTQCSPGFAGPSVPSSSQGGVAVAATSSQEAEAGAPRKVTWPDMQGHELASVREFEPSDPGDYNIDFAGWADARRSCCSLM